MYLILYRLNFLCGVSNGNNRPVKFDKLTEVSKTMTIINEIYIL